MFKKFIAVIFIFALAAVSFAAEATVADNLKKMIGEQKAKAPKVDVATLKSWMDEGKDMILLDVRTDVEVDAVSIDAPGFAHYTRGLVEFYFTRDNPDPDKLIVVYCKTGARGAFTTNRLIELGYTNVYNLTGGIVDWMKQGYEVKNLMGTFKSTAF